jgi:hypothetical protein
VFKGDAKPTVCLTFEVLILTLFITAACTVQPPPVERSGPAPVPNQSLNDVVLEPSIARLPRLVVNGQYFRLATGERFTVIELSEFNILGRLAAGEDVDPVLKQRADSGFNVLRVFTAYDLPNIGRMWPKEHPDLYSTLIPKLAERAARHGLRIEFVGFTGPYRNFFDNGDQMVAHWNSLISAVADCTNCTLELINEFDHPANAGVPLDRMLRPPPPILASHGSAVQDSTPLQPFWDYVTYHSSQPGKVVINCWSEIADRHHIPCVINETGRVPDNDSSLAHAEDIARGCALVNAGCGFHSVHGRSSELWSGLELTLAQTWARSAQAVPLEFQDGYHVHRDDLERGPAPCPCDRVYSRRLPDGREFIAPVRP